MRVKNRPARNRALSLIVSAFLLILTAPGVAPGAEEALENFIWAKVTSIYDGDTIAVEDDQGKDIRVQLAYIDAPDMDYKTGETQPLHDDSKKFLSKMIMGKEVIIESFGVDRFNRVEGMVFLDKLNVNREMVLKGMAEVYYPVRINPDKFKKKYVDEFMKAEELAKKDKEGVWGHPGYISPYEFRRREK